MSIVYKLLALGLVLSSWNAFAAQVCMEAPEGVTYSAINTNFDGGLTITDPKVFVGGEYLYVATPAPSYSAGVCRVFGRAPLSHKGHQVKTERVAHLNWDGTLITTYETDVANVLKYVHCAPPEKEE
jgi:hypothetical protein